ncbi:hypothetical protein SDJN03_19161, partial [Cucurbita argyrosperma subsp. sororia]
MASRKLFTVFAIVMMMFYFASSAKGDMFMECIRPCVDAFDDDSCYDDCVRANKGAGFCYPKLPSVTNEKDCCCNN